MWARFECLGDYACAEKDIDLTGYDDYWVEADVWIPAGTLTAIAADGFTAELLHLGQPFYSPWEGIWAGYAPTYTWWTYNCGGDCDSGVAVAADTTINLKVHVNVATSELTWYVDGAEILSTYTKEVINNGILVGGWDAPEDTCEIYFVTNVKVGTADGGTDIFADDFSSGDFSNWDATNGTCSVVASPVDDCVVPAIAVSPAGACWGGTVTVTGSGFSTDSPLTVTLDGTTPLTFSEADSDGSGNVDGTFDLPPSETAYLTINGSYEVVVTDGDGNTAESVIEICCPFAADTLDSIEQFGPTFTPDTDVFITPVDYIHHDDAHWVVCLNTPSDSSIFTTFPPPAFAPITVFRVPDDGMSVSSFDVDTDISWTFHEHSRSFLGCTEWKTIFAFSSWAKTIHDVRFGSDGTNIWLVVLNDHTDEYPYVSTDDGNTCGTTVYFSQATQFLTLSSITSGFTSFYTGGSGPPGTYARNIKTADGTLNFFHDSVPVSDGGDFWTGYWTTPRLNVFSLTPSAATNIGYIDTEFYNGAVAAQGNASGAGATSGRPGPLYNTSSDTIHRLLSGVSVAADPSEERVCHVVFAEGGSYGRYGGGGSLGPLASWAVWDGNAPSVGYRLNHSRWGPSAIIDENDLFSSTIDRTDWQFPYDAGSGVGMDGYTYPATADLAWSNVFQVRNDTGSPVLFIAPQETAELGSPDSHGNPDLDNDAWYPETVLAYDISSGSAVLDQTLNGSLLPGTSDGLSYDTNVVYPLSSHSDGGFQPGYNDLSGIIIANLYPDPLDSDTPVYLVGVQLADVDASGAIVDDDSLMAFYRIPADLSATFDYMDGIRARFYSIEENSYFDSQGLGPVRRFVTEPNNVWTDGGQTGEQGPWQLDRKCAHGWITYATLAEFNPAALDFYLADPYLYAVADFSPDGWALARLHICRNCANCVCSGGFHIWQRF